MVRYTEDGTLFTLYSADDGDVVGPGLLLLRAIQDLGEDVLWLSRKDDVARLDGDAVPPAKNIVAVGPDGADTEYDRALKAFAKRHGVLRVYRIMDGRS